MKKSIFIIMLTLATSSITMVSAQDKSKENDDSITPMATSSYCQTEYERCSMRASPYANALQTQCYAALRYCQGQGVFIIR